MDPSIDHLNDTSSTLHVSNYNHTISGHVFGHGNSEEHMEETPDAFAHVYIIMCFGAGLWIIGKMFAKMNLPSLIGEIIFGVMLGPPLLNWVPEPEALIIIGEMGLILLVIEAGIDVDVAMLKMIGFRGLLVALSGSTMPILISGSIAHFYFGYNVMTSFAIGASLAPTSMGIALKLLRHANLLNKVIGQEIIAAAILDDVIGLILLSFLSLHNPTYIEIAVTLSISPILLIIFLYLAVKILPPYVDAGVKKVSKKYREFFVLSLLFVSSFS